MVAVKINMPEKTMHLFGVPEQDIGREVLEVCTAKMYQEGRISLVQGKEILGLESITDFMEVLAANDTPVINYDLDDFKNELKNIGVL
jgi:predicted HTH domain antitoxin